MRNLSKTLFLLALIVGAFGFADSAHAAARFWVGGTGNWDASDTTHWAATSGGAGGQTVPGSGDTVTLDGNSGGGTVTITAPVTVTSITGGAFTGTLDTNGQSITAVTFSFSGTATRTLTLGSSSITLSSTATALDIATVTNLTLNRGTSAITLTGAGADINVGGNGGTAQSLYDVTFTGGGGTLITNGSAGLTFNNLTFTGTAAKTDAFFVRRPITVSGAFTVDGNSVTNRVLLSAINPGETANITANGTISMSNVDIKDINALGSASWNLSAITGLSGDCGGNSGITFTTPATQTSTGTASFTWSTHGWTSRVPLPQDDVVVNNAFVSGRTVSVDMPRAGHTLDFSGATWSGTAVTIAASGVQPTVFGSLSLPANIASGLAGSWHLEGRSASMPVGGWQITTAGNTLSNSFTFNAPGATYQLQDALTTTGSVTVTSGTLDGNGYNLTMATLVSTGALTRAITLGAGTWTMTSTGNAINFSGATNLTVTPGTSTIVISNTSATTKTVFLNGYTYNNIIFSGDNIAFGGGGAALSNTFNDFSVNNAGLTNGLKLPSGATQTITGTFSTNGSAGNLAKLIASTGGSAATLSKASGQVCVDYMSIQDSTATGGATWYAGANSTDVSGNTGWTFSACPAGGGGAADVGDFIWFE